MTYNSTLIYYIMVTYTRWCTCVFTTQRWAADWRYQSLRGNNANETTAAYNAVVRYTYISIYTECSHKYLTSNLSLIYATIQIFISEISYSIAILSKTFFYKKCSDFSWRSIIQWKYVGTKTSDCRFYCTFLIRRFSRKRPRT